MALVPITHVYDTLSVINNTGLLDGQILYTTDQTVNKIFADVKVNNILRRIEIGGTNEIDTVLNQESGHAIANSAVAKLAQTVHTNLLNPTLGTTTVNGVTCTANGDGTYTLSGTATANCFFTDVKRTFPAGTYRYCGTPSNGSTSTFKSGLLVDSTHLNDDTGHGVEITSDGQTKYQLRIAVYAGTTLPSGGVTFKPMLTTDLSATYDDFVQYSGNKELNQNVAGIYNNLTALDTKVGAQSLLPTPSQSVTQNINTLKSEINQLNSDLTDVSAALITGELSGVTIYSNQLHKNVKVVHLYAVIDIPAINYNDAWIAKIPDEFKPSQDRYIVGTASDGTVKGFSISTSGHLRNAESIPNKTYYFDSTWIL